jgi:hypothetical protein
MISHDRWKRTLMAHNINPTRCLMDRAFLRGVRHAFGLPAFCYWASCIAFVYFARDGGADWIRTIAAAATNWPSSKVLIVMIDESKYSIFIVSVTTLLSSLCLLPTSTLLSHHMEGSFFGRLLLAPTMTYTVWVAVDRGEALPDQNRQAFLAGVCLTFFIGNLVCTALALFAPVALSPAAMMCMAVITPLFYGLNLLGGALSASAVAMLGLAFFAEPLIARMAPQGSVPLSGLASFGVIWAFRTLRSVQ